MHTSLDFFIPINLSLPDNAKTFLKESFVFELQEVQRKKKQLGLYPLPDDSSLKDMKSMVEDFLRPMGLKSGAFGAFALTGSMRDKNIHVDAMRLNTRLSFYELAETPGEIHWYSDDGTGYESWRPSYLGGSPILDYRYPWVDELQAGQRTWDECPAPIFKASTNVPSALVMTSLPHNVVQGSGFRITVSCQVVDLENNSIDNTWKKVRSYFSSTASLASAS